ncbi:MAG: hypothetical protein KIS81_00545 [Maricaulaceae bacterium]|nr:hypothetical protein [Maricaulaceae bacterium]
MDYRKFLLSALFAGSFAAAPAAFAFDEHGYGAEPAEEEEQSDDARDEGGDEDEADKDDERPDDDEA